MTHQPYGYTKPSRPPVGHGMHLVLTLFTCGLWLPVWIAHVLIDLCMPARQSVHYAPVQPFAYPAPYPTNRQDVAPANWQVMESNVDHPHRFSVVNTFTGQDDGSRWTNRAVAESHAADKNRY